MPRYPFVLCSLLLFTAGVSGQDLEERYARAVKFEDETSRKLVERIQKPGESEREKWYKRLDEVYTGRVPDDPTYWFDLVTTGRGEWTRDMSRFFADFHERICQRLELKKTDPVTRDVFVAYARQYLGPNSPPWRMIDVDEESRGPFKTLDLNKDGFLAREECSPGLGERFTQADANGDGKVDQAEYKAYFRARVEYEAQTTVPEVSKEDRKREEQQKEQKAKEQAAEDAKPTTYRDPKQWPKEVPKWFTQLDEDRDHQIGLYEWKKFDRPIGEFLAMDLNGDRLLEVSEYLRYLRIKASSCERPSELRASLPPGKSSKEK
jgi:hypothetical protein